ncbi:MAG TPA: hypothetical protein VFS07_09480 [Gemmatimonadales bacterium]|nr:hypothetical protein [Gemmatimonadales bacterium]
MARTTFIEHRGKRIARLDFAGFTEADAALEAIAEARALIQAQPPKSVYSLTIVRGSRFNSAVLSAMKALAADNAPFVRAGAVVGMGPLHKAAYLTVMYFSKRTIPAFDTEDEALAWIAKQE